MEKQNMENMDIKPPLDISSYMHLNLSKVCRICLLEKPQLKNMDTISDMIMECSSLHISGGEGTHLICDQCESEVKQWYLFKKKVQKSIEIAWWLSYHSKHHKKEQSKNHPPTLETSDFIIKNEFGIDHGLECPKCVKVFKNTRTLKEHLKRHYNIKNYSCDVCNKRYYRKQCLVEHMRVHTGEKPYKCEVCNKFFKTYRLLNSHMKRVHTEAKPCICKTCSKSFADNYLLKVHSRIHTDEKLFRCSYCTMSFRLQGQMKSHVKYCHTKERDFVCHLCARAFTAKHTLKEHLRTHTGEKRESKHKCDICDKKCSTSAHLKRHIQSQHTGERPFLCRTCGKRFLCKSHLDGHFTTHTKEKSFVCPCGKAFRLKGTLNKHKRIHTGEKPFTCLVCDRRFRQSGTLKTHLRTHKKCPGEEDELSKL